MNSPSSEKTRLKTPRWAAWLVPLLQLSLNSASAEPAPLGQPPSIIYFPTAPTLLATEGKPGSTIISGEISYRFTAKVKERDREKMFGKETESLVEKGDFLYGVPIQTRNGMYQSPSWLWCAPKFKKKWIARCFGPGDPPRYTTNTTSPFLFDQSLQAYPAYAPGFELEPSQDQFGKVVSSKCFLGKWQTTKIWLGCVLEVDGQPVGGHGRALARRSDGTAHFSLGGASFLVSPVPEGFKLTQETQFSNGSSAIIQDLTP